MVVGQRCFGGCRLNETACVEACAIQVLQPLRQARQERVFDQVRYQLGEQFRSLLILRVSPVPSLDGRWLSIDGRVLFNAPLVGEVFC